MGIVVVCFGVGFFCPLGEVEFAAIILCFDADAAVVGVADVGDVALVSRPSFDPSVYAVVEVVAEVITYDSLKSGSGSFS